MMTGQHDQVIASLRLEVKGLKDSIVSLERGHRAGIKDGDGPWKDVTDTALDHLRASRDRFTAIADELEAEDTPRRLDA
jgi:hypothetical protein